MKIEKSVLPYLSAASVALEKAEVISWRFLLYFGYLTLKNKPLMYLLYGVVLNKPLCTHTAVPRLFQLVEEVF